MRLDDHEGAFGRLVVAVFEGYVFFDAVEVAVDGGEHPTGGDYELHADIAVIRAAHEITELVIEFHQVLGRLFAVYQNL